jgi:DNA-directed RNA polymerase subunit omega
MDSELCMKALEKIGNPNLLINLISRRVRQLNAGGGALSRPLVDNAETLGAADIALRETIEGKITYQLLDEKGEPQPAPKRKRRRAAAS